MRIRHSIQFGMFVLILTAAMSVGRSMQTSPSTSTAAAAQVSTSATPAGQTPQPAANAQALPSKAFLWEDLEVRKQDFGDMRQLFRSPTATLDELEIHATTLNPGQRPHPPHQHAYEEMLVLREGTLEATVNSNVIALTAGSVLFLAPNDLHGWQNKGATPAKYYIITWRTPRTAPAK